MAQDIVLPGIDDGGTAQQPAPDGNVSAADAGGEAALTDKSQEQNAANQQDMLDVVLRARDRFEYVESVDSENRQNAIEDSRFAWERGGQWNPDNRRQREMADPPRPWLEFNQTGPFIKRITNDQRKNQPSIKVRPAGGGATKKIADIQSGLIRAIEQDSQASSAYDTGFEHAVTSGRGYWRVLTDWEAEDSFNQVAKIASLQNPSAVYMDPDAKEPDKSDIQYAFICDWVDQQTYEREWPEAGQAVSWDIADGNDEWACWYNAGKVCVADYYEICEYDDTLVLLDNGLTMWQKDYTQMRDAMIQSMSQKMAQMQQQPGSMLMMDPMQPPGGAPPPPPTMLPVVKKTETRKRKRVDWYKVTARDQPLAKYEWAGRYIPVIMCVGDEFVIDGKRIYQGLIRRVRDAQMMYNYAYTMMVERVALAPRAPYVGAAGQFENQKGWDTLNTENHPFLEYNIVEAPGGTVVATPPQRTEPITVDQGLVTILQLCADNLRAITGQMDKQAPDPRTPWRALVQSERQGDLSTFHYGDNEARAIAHTGRILVDLDPKIYDTQRAIRIVDIDGTESTETVNQAIPPADLSAPPTIQNNLKQGRYDIVVETGPSFATRRVEAASEINEFMQTIGPQGAMLVADLFADMADWPGDVGERVARRLKATLPPQVAAADQAGAPDPQVQQLTQQLQGMQQQLQQLTQSAQDAIKKLTDQNAELKVKVQGKGLDFLGTLVEANSKRDDAQQSRLMAAEGNASDEYIAKLGFANDISQEIIKMGLPPMMANPVLMMVAQMVGRAGQGMRRGPDFGDVANALQQAQDRGNAMTMGAVEQGAQQLSQPAMVPASMLTPPNGPPGAPPGPPGGNGQMPPGGPPQGPPGGMPPGGNQ